MLKKTKLNNCKMLIGMLVIMAFGLWGCSPKAPTEEFLLGGETEPGSMENCEASEGLEEAGSAEASGNTESSGTEKVPENEGNAGTTGASGEPGVSVEIADGQSFEAAGAGQNVSSPAVIYVHVCGAVKAPGVYCLPENARVYEAVEAAGGFQQDADQDWLNQAGTLKDGEKLQVFTKEETTRMKESGVTEGQISGTNSISGGGNGNSADISGSENAAVADGNGAGADNSSGLVNINTASREELMTLPGIGEAKADAVLAYREAQGSFEKIEDIMKISGIKEAVFLNIKDRITVY